MLKPELLSSLGNYNKERFFADVVSGSIVGVVALPLAIAFAIASGVSPEKGLFTAIVAGFIISALGGSKVQIGGPTGAFVVIVYGIVQKYGVDGLAVATLMAGAILVLLGIGRFGSIIKFIPHPVIVGFTSGIAIIIFSSQIKDFLGLRMGAVPADFVDKWGSYAQAGATLNLYALLLGMLGIFIIIFWPRISRKIPGSLVALIVTTAAAQLLQLPVETIGSRFGEIPSTLPIPSLPSFDFARMKELVNPALSIAILGGIEALLSAVVADGMIGGRHRSNMELVANGLANLASPLFGGIPATGAIARTATNVKNGGRSPIAGIVHALVLLLIMLFFGRLASLIPMATLASILIVVSYNMSEWRSFRGILRSPRSDVAVLLSTFFLTVLVDLTVAIEVGLVLSAFLFMRRMAMVTNVGSIREEFGDDDVKDVSDPLAIEKRYVPSDVEVYEINGPLFFGAAYKFEESISIVENPPKVLILRMRNVPAIDSTGLHVLEQFLHTCEGMGTVLVLSGVSEQVIHTLKQAHLAARIGSERIFDNIDAALGYARGLSAVAAVERPVLTGKKGKAPRPAKRGRGRRKGKN